MEVLRIIQSSGWLAVMFIGLLAAIVIGTVSHRGLRNTEQRDELHRLQRREEARAKTIEHQSTSLGGSGGDA